MRVHVDFPGSQRIQATCKDLTFEIGMPPDRGGDPDAYGPFDLLLSGLALCTGFHVISFLEERGLSIEKAGLTVKAERGADSHLLETVTVEIRVPQDFPAKYNDAIVRAAGLCLVKAQLGRAPECVTSVVRV